MAADNNGTIYNEENVTYDSYSGTEQNLYCNFKMTDGTPRKFRLGKVSSITVSTQTSGKPIGALGKKRYIGYAQGMSVTGGSLSFETLEQSAIEELKKAFKEAYNSIDLDKVKGLNDLPPFDIEIIAKKDNNPNVVSKRTVKNVILMGSQSAIGIDNITVGEAYQFTAQTMTPFIQETDTKGNAITSKKTFSFQTRK